MGAFLTDRGDTVSRARDRYGTGTPDHVMATDASAARAIIYTFNRRHFVRMAKRQEGDGTLSYPGMTVASFKLAHPRGLPRLRTIITDIEAVH